MGAGAPSSFEPTHEQAKEVPVRQFRHVMIAMSGPLLAAMQPALAQDASNPAMYMISYVEAAPAAKAQVMGLLKQLADASRKETGVLRFEVLQRSAPSHHFAILAAWKDQQGLDAHAGAAHTKQFTDRSEPLLITPVDERYYIAIAVSAGRVV